MTADGIRNFFGAITGEDLVNYRINTAVVDMLLDNTAASPVIIASARLYRDDGSTVIAAASGSIQMDPDKAYLAQSDIPAFWDYPLATGTTASEAMDILTAVAAGKVSGGPGSPVFRSIDDTRNVVTGVADSNGNRTTSTITAEG
jgi:hypothetical protein